MSVTNTNAMKFDPQYDLVVLCADRSPFFLQDEQAESGLQIRVQVLGG
jgi:hypothetical protein